MFTARVQPGPFDLAAELAALTTGRTDVGGVVSFTGHVRGGEVTAMTLEHYPAMTQPALQTLVSIAAARWPLLAATVIHRTGRLLPGDPIVLVATAARHRHAALESCAWLIEALKTQAPFWKQEETSGGVRWVEP